MRMRSWLAIAVVVSLLTLAACNGDDNGDNGDTTPTETPSSGATTEPEETPPDGAATDGYEQLLVFAGEWSGAWNNDTFGSTGAITLSIVVNEDGTWSATLDIDGPVFGANDPTARTVSGTYDASGATGQLQGDDVFGDVTLSATLDGTIVIAATNIPAAGIASLTAEGTATPDGIAMTYTVTFDDGTTAEGTGTLTKS